MVEHYSASGWLPSTGDDEGLIDLVAQGAMEGWMEPLPDATEYRVLGDSTGRFELWLFAAHGQVRGAVPYLHGNVKWDIVIDRFLPRITGGLGAVEIHRPEEPDQRLCVEMPDFARIHSEDAGKTLPATITGLAYLCRTVPVEEEFLCIPRLYPFGVLGDCAVSAGEGSRCDIIACGRIQSVQELRNQVTGLAVWVLTLEIGSMSLCVAAAPDMVEGDMPEVGRVFEGVFWLVGRVTRRKGSGAIGRAIQRLSGT